MQDYLDRHELSKKVEDAINATVKSKPDEPLAFLVSGGQLTVCSLLQMISLPTLGLAALQASGSSVLR